MPPRRAPLVPRAARTADAPALARLYLAGRPPEDWLGPELALAVAETLIGRHAVRVLEGGQGIIGYVGWGDGVLRHLFIDTAHRGQGHGGRLLGLAKAANARLVLHLPAAHAAARAFYLRHGFVLAGGSPADEQNAFLSLAWERDEQEEMKS